MVLNIWREQCKIFNALVTSTQGHQDGSQKFPMHICESYKVWRKYLAYLSISNGEINNRRVSNPHLHAYMSHISRNSQKVCIILTCIEALYRGLPIQIQSVLMDSETLVENMDDYNIFVKCLSLRNNSCSWKKNALFWWIKRQSRKYKYVCNEVSYWLDSASMAWPEKGKP